MEMMVAMGILSIIIVGLLAMFEQTQKALRAGSTQTDVMETGRAIMDLMQREIQQATPSRIPGCVNFYAVTNDSNDLFPPLTQKVAGGGPDIVYDIEEVFFLMRIHQEWKGIGYFVNITNNSGVGTLYRFVDVAPHSQVTNLFNAFLQERQMLKANPSLSGTDRTHRVADGIVHFEMHVYDRDGFLFPDTNSFNIYKTANYAVFRNTAIPFSVELELGVLEPPVLSQIRGMPGAIARAFLQDERRAGRVHLFRQRIPIRCANDQ